MGRERQGNAHASARLALTRFVRAFARDWRGRNDYAGVVPAGGTLSGSARQTKYE